MIKRRGNISLYLLVIFFVLALTITSAVTLDRKANSIKRQNIHNAVIAANLASYYAIEQGDKDTCLSYTPEELRSYLKDPNTIVSSGKPIESVVNLVNSEYFDKGERYKSVYMTKDKAYKYFVQALKNNLDLNEKSEYNFEASNINDDGIISLKINNFDVYNSISEDFSGIKVSNILKNEKRKYTGIDLDLTAKIEHIISCKNITETIDIPIHIDTEVTIFRPVLN